jgi:hypothetical protein
MFSQIRTRVITHETTSILPCRSLKKRPKRRVWALEQLRPQTHHPDLQPAAHTAFQTHWARLVSNMGHRSPHLRVLGAHFYHF